MIFMFYTILLLKTSSFDKYLLAFTRFKHEMRQEKYVIQGVSGRIVNILGCGSMDYSE